MKVSVNARRVQWEGRLAVHSAVRVCFTPVGAMRQVLQCENATRDASSVSGVFRGRKAPFHTACVVRSGDAVT